MHLSWAIEVLTDLDRCLEFGRQLGMPVEIVVDDRFFDPVEAMAVDHVTSIDCFGEI